MEKQVGYISDKSVIIYRGRVVEMGPTMQDCNNPRHPYTQMLMNSVPRMDKKWDEKSRDLIEKHSRPAGGCLRYSRCPLADAK